MKKISTVVLYSLMALVLVFGLVALPARAADHLDAPGGTSPGGDTRLDITDVYAFQSPNNPDNTVLIMDVNPLAGVLNDGTFRSGASYEFKIDTNGDAKEDLTYKIKFSKPKGDGRQSVKLECEPEKRCQSGKGGDHDKGVLARGKTGSDISVKGGGMLHAGVFDDPFFFDLDNFKHGATFCGTGLPVMDFFAGLNISAIVLEVPSSSFSSNNIGVWAQTMLKGEQIDRMGRPAINTVFIPNNPFEPVGSEPSQKNDFNAGKPRDDQRDFRGEVVDTLLLLGNNQVTADALADFLLPDILTVDTSSSAGFPNGRALADDVIDTELSLITGGGLPSDCIANDSIFNPSFPYLASPNP